jgi:NAD(P)-dependent dehydrogenase (short-subunit alcohol dehydrogenase family)
MDLLKDKIAVVTGAGRGIGRATALAFAREGAKVVVNDADWSLSGEPDGSRSAEQVVEEIVAAGGSAVADEHSVTTSEGAEAIIARAVDAFGGLDVLVNNAGILGDTTLERLTFEQWRSVLDVQLGGAFACCQAAARVMRRARRGAIVNTTGVAGMRGNFGQAHAAAAAAGVYGLTRTASIELQRHGIRVNAVAPIAKTRMTENLPMFEQVDSMRAEHVAPAHVFLASDLSQELTGVVLAVAGGKLSVFRIVESLGALKDDDGGVWSPEEIAEHWSTISKI